MKNEILSNRQKSKIAKRGKHWCCKCDHQIVGKLGKCSNCGYLENKKKNEKQK